MSPAQAWRKIGLSAAFLLLVPAAPLVAQPRIQPIAAVQRCLGDACTLWVGPEQPAALSLQHVVELPAPPVSGPVRPALPERIVMRVDASGPRGLIVLAALWRAAIAALSPEQVGLLLGIDLGLLALAGYAFARWMHMRRETTCGLEPGIAGGHRG